MLASRRRVAVGGLHPKRYQSYYPNSTHGIKLLCTAILLLAIVSLLPAEAQDVDPCGGCSTVGTLSQFCLEGTAFCECRPGYTGQFCTILLATTAPTVITTTPTAAATTPTAPATTTPQFSSCPDAYCGNDAVSCTGIRGNCVCGPAYTGDLCQIPIRELQRCDTEPFCECVPELEGRFCQSDAVLFRVQFTYAIEYTFSLTLPRVLQDLTAVSDQLLVQAIGVRSQLAFGNSSNRNVFPDSRGRLALSYDVTVYRLPSVVGLREQLDAILQTAFFFNGMVEELPLAVAFTQIEAVNRLQDLINTLAGNASDPVAVSQDALLVVTSLDDNLNALDLGVYVDLLEAMDEPVANGNDLQGSEAVQNHVLIAGGFSALRTSTIEAARETVNFTTRLYTGLEELAFALSLTPNNSMPVVNLSADITAANAPGLNLVLMRVNDVDEGIGVQATFLNNNANLSSLPANDSLVELRTQRALNDVEIVGTPSSFVPTSPYKGSLFVPNEVFQTAQNSGSVSNEMANGTAFSLLMAFTFFDSPALFLDPSLAARNAVVATPVISATVADTPVENLKRPVEIQFDKTRLQMSAVDLEPECAYWDPRASGGLGAWNTTGCQLVSNTATTMLCHCNHLTNFAVLLARRPPSGAGGAGKALTVVTYIGCGVSITALLALVALHFSKRVLRCSSKSKLRCVLSVNLLLLLLLFVAGVERTEVAGVCRGVALLIHYFLLAVFAWSMVQGYNVYHHVCKSWEAHTKSTKVTLISLGIGAQGVPAFIVTLSAILNWNAYYPIGIPSNERLCRLEYGTSFLASVVFPLAVFVFVNLVFFLRIWLVIVSQQAQGATGDSAISKRRDRLKRQARSFLILVVTLGMTWASGIALIATSHVATQWLFTVLVSTQGILLFVHQWTDMKRIRRESRSLNYLSYRTTSRQASKAVGSGTNIHLGVYGVNETTPDPAASQRSQAMYIDVRSSPTRGQRADSGLGTDSLPSQRSSGDTESNATVSPVASEALAALVQQNSGSLPSASPSNLAAADSLSTILSNDAVSEEDTVADLTSSPSIPSIKPRTPRANSSSLIMAGSTSKALPPSRHSIGMVMSTSNLVSVNNGTHRPSLP
ncbi:adhesion G-protein coupled receptor G7-like isoform X2 [Sycon ciliatum]|uniref:adhesion G-protein coupled receptor G7-like isoform X2 n=1 Tax=Sycon ciliatum TaxID=27933 RepID=UPI0031F5FFEE